MIRLIRIHWAQSSNMFRPFPPFRHHQLAQILVFFSTFMLFGAATFWIRKPEEEFFTDAGSAPRLLLLAILIFVGVYIYAQNDIRPYLNFRQVSYQGMKFKEFYLPSLIARLVSIPMIMTAIFSFLAIQSGAVPSFGGVVASILGTLFSLLSIVLLIDLGHSIGSNLRQRFELRFWINASFVSILVIIVVAATVFVAKTSLGSLWELIMLLAVIGAWIPPLSAWFLPAMWATGDGLIIFLSLVVNLVGIAAIGYGAYRLAKKVSILRTEIFHRVEEGRLGLFRLFPDTDTGAIAARSMIYRLFDSRYRLDMLGLIILPIFVTVTLNFVSVPTDILALIPVPLFALMLGWSVHNDIAFDGSAFWQHLATGITERADRYGRTIPLALLGGVVVITGSVLSALVVEDVSLIPTIIGFSAAGFGAATGIGSITAVVSIYPSPGPHQSAFKQPLLVQGQASGAPVSLISAMVLTLIPIGTFLLLRNWQPIIASIITMVVGIAVGAIIYYVGMRYSSYVLRKRGPELMTIIRSAQ